MIFFNVQAMWLSTFMDEIGLNQQRLVKIFADNNGAITNTLNFKNHCCTKHSHVQHHFVKEKVMMGDVTYTYIPSADNLADILMIPLARDAVACNCQGIGLLP
jgi:hypothetical protein